jgi:5'-methylthioadenosine phosphorylase
LSYFSKPLHILAKPGDIAERVIVVGDPKRAEILKEFLENPRLVNENRGFYTYTGLYRGVPLTIAVHGIGAPSAQIVFEELSMLGAKVIVRFGTAGALVEDLDVGDVILSISANYYSGGLYYQYTEQPVCISAVADYNLLKHVEKYMLKHNVKYTVGSVISADRFYIPVKEFIAYWRKFGVKAVEMETAILYILGAIRGYKALSTLLISNSLVKETGYPTAIELKEHVLEIAEPLLEAISTFKDI